MLKKKMEKVKAVVKKYHLDYLAIAAGGIAVGAIAHKLISDDTDYRSGDANVGVSPCIIDGQPGIRCNIYSLLKDGTEKLTSSFLFDRERLVEFNKVSFEVLEEALKKKAENE